MSDPDVNDPAEMNKALRDAARSLGTRITLRELLPHNAFVAWLTRPQPPGIHWHRLNNRTHRVEIRREG